jgi:esterase/lipase superfamily enzyme
MLASLLVASALATQPVQTERAIGPLAVDRVESLNLQAGDVVVVQPIGPAALAIHVEVYDQTKVLVARDDEDVDAEAFEWTAPTRGRYYILVRNSSSVQGTYRFRIVVATGPRGSPPAQSPTYSVVRVHYATNRVRGPDAASGVTFASEPTPDGRLTLGTVDVSVPRDHRMGELEGPSILRLEFRADPERHIVLLKTETQPVSSFFAAVAASARRSPRREAFVFVHGFATTFEDAARRTAQMAYDLAFAGATVLYSWPSRGSVGLVDYNSDGRNAELSVEPLRQFLEQLVKETNVSTVHVIAHSMGNRVVTNALDALARSAVRLPQIGQVALMAPDIDAQVFRALAARIKGVPSKLTLYASSRDGALRASQQLVGYPRAGQGGDALVVVPGIDTVDASPVDTSLIGVLHSYYADNRAVVSDLFYLLRGTSPEDRAMLRQRSHRDGIYWEFVPASR